MSGDCFVIICTELIYDVVTTPVTDDVTNVGDSTANGATFGVINTSAKMHPCPAQQSQRYISIVALIPRLLNKQESTVSSSCFEHPQQILFWK